MKLAEDKKITNKNKRSNTVSSQKMELTKKVTNNTVSSQKIGFTKHPPMKQNLSDSHEIQMRRDSIYTLSPLPLITHEQIQAIDPPKSRSHWRSWSEVKPVSLPINRDGEGSGVYRGE